MATKWINSKSDADFKEAEQFANKVIGKIQVESIGYEDEGHYKSLLKPLAQLNLLPPFMHVLEETDVFDIDAIVEMASKNGWDMFLSRILHYLCSFKANANEKLRIMMKCTGYDSESEIKPVLLTGVQIDICERIAAVIVKDEMWNPTQNM